MKTHVYRENKQTKKKLNLEICSADFQGGRVGKKTEEEVSDVEGLSLLESHVK
jgi:hypothetical protein